MPNEHEFANVSGKSPEDSKLNDSDDPGGKQEHLFVDPLDDGDTDRVILGCRCKRANDSRLQTSLP